MTYEMIIKYKRSASLDQNEITLAMARVREGVLNFVAKFSSPQMSLKI